MVYMPTSFCVLPTPLHLFITESVGFHKFPMSTQLQASLPTTDPVNVYGMRLGAQETRARSVQAVRERVCVEVILMYVGGGCRAVVITVTMREMSHIVGCCRLCGEVRRYLDYGNFKLSNQVAGNTGSIFHSHLFSGIYSWLQGPGSGIYWDACC